MDNTLIHSTNGTFLFKKTFHQESRWRSDDCYKFIFSPNGMTNYQTERNQLTIHHNQYLLINPHDKHKQISVEKNKFLIELDAYHLNEIAKSILPLDYDIQFATFIQKHEQISKWAHFMINYIKIEKDSPFHSKQIFLDHSFTQLSILLVTNGLGTQTDEINLRTYKFMSPQIFKTMQALKEDYQHDWTLEEMANISHLSKFRFAHYFKEVVGVSPYSWLQIYRLVQSQNMLKQSNKTILEIALACGFSSVNVYNQLFKQLYGMSPSYFRKMISK